LRYAVSKWTFMFGYYQCEEDHASNPETSIEQVTNALHKKKGIMSFEPVKPVIHN